MEGDIKQQLEAIIDGYDEWFERRRHRRANVLRSATLIVAVALCVGSAAWLMPQRSDTYVTGSLSCCTAEACHHVSVMLASL